MTTIPETPTSPSMSPSTKKMTRRFSERRGRANSYAIHHDVHQEALGKIRAFLKSRSAFDVFPLSYKVVVFDTKLPVKHALNTMHSQGIVSAPIYDQKNWKFAGMLTLSDIIHLIQFYYLKAETFETAAADVETFRIESLRDVERQLNVPPPPLHSIHPSRPLLEACKLLIESHARRLPLIDHDSTSGMELIASVLTQYRALKFISNNCKEIKNLNLSLKSLHIGTYVDAKPDDPYYPIATATMDTTVFEVVQMFSARGISAVPILNSAGVVTNIYETLDVTTLIRSGTYTKLDLSIRSALALRSIEFPGVVTCSGSDSLGKLLEFIGVKRVHRLVVVDPESGKLTGIITLSDILQYLVKDTMSYPSTPLPPQVESTAEAED